MNRQTTTTWACAALIALTLASAHLLDGPGDVEAEQRAAASAKDAVDQAATLHCAQFGRVPLWVNGDDLVCRLPAASRPAPPAQQQARL
jgi:hypothetical protein